MPVTIKIERQILINRTMTTFRTAIANYPSDEITAIAKRDIVELDEKIQLFETGKIDPEKFRSLRLAR